MKSLVDFKEKPVTIEEREVASVLELMARAVQAKEFETLRSVYLPDAKIIGTLDKPLGEGVTSGDQHIAHIIKMFSESGSPKVRFEDVLVRVINDCEAAVYFYLVISASEFSKKIAERYFKFVKQDRVWRIVEAGGW